MVLHFLRNYATIVLSLFGVVVIAGFSLGSAHVFSGFLPGHTTDISWPMGPDLCFLKCETEKSDTPEPRAAEKSEI